VEQAHGQREKKARAFTGGMHDSTPHTPALSQTRQMRSGTRNLISSTPRPVYLVINQINPIKFVDKFYTHAALVRSHQTALIQK
jgi:hypothetical protein